MNTDSLYLNQLKFDPKLKSGVMHFLIQRTRIVILAILSLIFAGVFSFIDLPRELNPEVEIPIVSIVTTLPGASPTEVERSLTQPIERSLNDLTEVDTLSSFSNNSVSQVTLQFTSRTDPDQAVLDVRDRIDRISAEFPENATDPVVQKFDFTQQPVLTVAISGDVNRVSLAETAQRIQDELEANVHISRVEISGSQTETVTVQLKPTALAAYGISAEQITQSLQASNISFPAGAVKVNGAEYTINLDNQYQQLDQVQNLYLSINGQSIQLAQLADIFYDYDDNNRRAYTITPQGDRQNAIQLSIYKTANATIFEAADFATDYLQSYLAANPTIEYVEVVNMSQSVQEQFTSLTNNFGTTLLLVFGILLLFLGLRQATIASISIPLTFLSAFIIMNITGISLNFLSLFSLLLALGLVVDNAIVVVEATNEYGKRFSPAEAGLLVYKDFVVPIWTATLTTVWAFLPLLLATGIIGAFIKSIPIVVSATLLSSTTIAVFINIPLSVMFAHTNLPGRVKIALGVLGYILILGLISLSVSGSPVAPMAIGLFVVLSVVAFLARRQIRTQGMIGLRKIRGKLGINQLSKSRFERIFDEGLVSIEPLVQLYQRQVEKLLKNKSYRYKLYGFTVAFMVISIMFLALGLLKNEFFPATDAENMYIMVEAPIGSDINYTENVLRQVESIVIEKPGIESVLTITGSSFDPNTGGSGQSGTHVGYLSLKLVKADDRPLTSIELAEQFRQEFEPINAAEIQVVELSGGPPAGADLQINIKGSDLTVLEQISQDFIEIVGNIEGTVNIQSSLVQTAGQVVVDLDAAALAQRGLSPVQIGSSLRTAISGSTASSLKLDDEDTDIRVIMAGDETSLSDIAQLPLMSPTGVVLLSEVAQLRLETSPVTIEREDESRVVRVTAATTAQTSAPQVLAEFETIAADYDLPLGYTWDVGGVNQENEESVNSILQAMLLSGLLILVTMVVQLESFRQSLLVMSVIPLAIAGVFFNFTILGIPLSFPALIGVLALFGIVVNNSIILMEKINQNRKFGFNVPDSISDAASSRLQPILLTSLTTSAGLLPITLSDPLWRGLGGAIIAGLSVSGLLILLILPSLYFEVYGEKNSAKNNF